MAVPGEAILPSYYSGSYFINRLIVDKLKGEIKYNFAFLINQK